MRKSEVMNLITKYFKDKEELTEEDNHIEKELKIHFNQHIEATKEEINEAIIRLTEEENISTQKELENRLKDLNIDISQATIHRTLPRLDIEKGEDSFYKRTQKRRKEDNEQKLEELVEKENPMLFSHVTPAFLQTGQTNASTYAYYLKELFPDVLLDITVKDNGLFMLINLNAPNVEDLYYLINGKIPDIFEKEEDE